MIRAAIDPELHILRTIGRSQEGRARSELESARFNLFAAAEAGALEDARRWCAALRVALLVVEDGDLRTAGLTALDRIVAVLA